MNHDEQRVAIAKACGWTGFDPDNIPDCLQFTACNPEGKWGLIPDYPNDLNACYEMEQRLPDGKVPYPYYEILAAVCAYRPRAGDDRHEYMFYIVSAAAVERAEAFLRTLDLWVE